MSLSAPTKIFTPWATSGQKVTIPPAADNILGRAGWDQGFPPINLTAKEAGGIPPFGQDMNGLGFAVSQALQWIEATGGVYPYDSAFATAIAGYPAGALVSRTDNSGYWRNTTAGNTTDPEAFGAGWQPEQAGVTSVAMSNANYTLTALEAGRSIIRITGTLTANLNLIFPTYQQQWLVVNSASGAFSVTCKTSAGSGVAVAAGATAQVYGDGTNISTSQASVTQAGVSGARKNLKIVYAGASSTVSVIADELCLGNGSGSYVTLRNLNLIANSGGSSGVANSLDTGAWAFSTFYYLFVIYNGSTASLLWSLSSTSPSLPSGYAYYARVGANKIQSATNYWFLCGGQMGAKFRYTPTPATNLTTQPTLASANTSGSVSAVAWASSAPPTSAMLSLSAQTGSGTCSVAIYDGPSGGHGLYAVYTQAVEYARDVLAAAPNVYWSSSGGVCTLNCLGWEDSI